MKFRINKTNEIKEINYIVNGCDISEDIIFNEGGLCKMNWNESKDLWIVDEEEFEHWKNFVEKAMEMESI